MKIALVVSESMDLYGWLGVYAPLACLRRLGLAPGLTLELCSAVPLIPAEGPLQIKPDRVGETLEGYAAIFVPGGEAANPVDAEWIAWMRTAQGCPLRAAVGSGAGLLEAAGLASPQGQGEVLLAHTTAEAPGLGLALCERIAGGGSAMRVAKELGLAWEDMPLIETRRPARTAQVNRETNETRVEALLDLDGSGRYEVQTGLGFLDHMLAQLALHGLFDLQVRARGDIQVDAHHTVEDVALALGEAFRQALGDRKGIVRMASASVPMDESLVTVTVDFSGRPYAVIRIPWHNPEVGGIPTRLFTHFCEAFAGQARCNLHARLDWGEDDHHQAEALFKALGRALDAASRIDARRQARVPSTKGTLE